MTRIERHRPAVGERGFVLVAVLVLVFSVLIIGAAFFSLAGYETRDTQSDLASQRAFWLAEGGKDRALRWLTNQTRPPETDLNIYQSVAGPDGGTYTVDCLVDTASIYLAEKAFVLDCVGLSGGRQRRIRERVRMTSFAQYAYFTDEEVGPGGTEIWFTTGDVIEGQLHTNGTVRILGNPHFIGPLTSASDHMVGSPNYRVEVPSDWPVGGNHPTFDQGFTLNAPVIPLPSQTLDLRSLAQSGGIYISAEAEVELGVTGLTTPVSNPGWLRYRNVSPPSGQWTSVRISTLSNKILYGNNDIHVEGLLDGQLTVASNRNVRIEDNLTYLASNAQGTPLPGCNDLLGIVAGRDVIFVDNTANATNLIVDAVLMALNTSITAENYDQHNPRGVLTIWGGLIQQNRGAVGTVNSSGNINHGYSKNYHYDDRVTGYAPPGFPMTGVYEEIAWMETWDASNPF
jgi:hypothetical protein